MFSTARFGLGHVKSPASILLQIAVVVKAMPGARTIFSAQARFGLLTVAAETAPANP